MLRTNIKVIYFINIFRKNTIDDIQLPFFKNTCKCFLTQLIHTEIKKTHPHLSYLQRHVHIYRHIMKINHSYVSKSNFSCTNCQITICLSRQRAIEDKKKPKEIVRKKLYFNTNIFNLETFNTL